MKGGGEANAEGCGGARAESSQARGGYAPEAAETVPVKQAPKGPPPAFSRTSGSPVGDAPKAILEAKPAEKQSTRAKVDDPPKAKDNNTEAVQPPEQIPLTSDAPTTTAARRSRSCPCRNRGQAACGGGEASEGQGRVDRPTRDDGSQTHGRDDWAGRGTSRPSLVEARSSPVSPAAPVHGSSRSRWSAAALSGHSPDGRGERRRRCSR